MSASPAADLGLLAENRWALRKQILKLAVPVVMEQILTTLTQMVDTMMVSPSFMAIHDVRQGSAPHIPAAANEASATGGVIAETTA